MYYELLLLDFFILLNSLQAELFEHKLILYQGINKLIIKINSLIINNPCIIWIDSSRLFYSFHWVMVFIVSCLYIERVFQFGFCKWIAHCQLYLVCFWFGYRCGILDRRKSVIDFEENLQPVSLQFFLQVLFSLKL